MRFKPETTNDLGDERCHVTSEVQRVAEPRPNPPEVSVGDGTPECNMVIRVVEARSPRRVGQGALRRLPK